MRKTARAFALIFVSLLTSVLLGVASAFMASLAFGAAVTALIVPGTGTHDANNIIGYNTNAENRYLGGTACTAEGNTCTLNAIEYPASFWPLGFIGNWCPGYKCDKWDQSVGAGVDTLDATIKNTDGPIVLFGYSQGGAVVSDELRNLQDDPESLAKISDVVMIGNILNPDGGLWNRLGLGILANFPIPGLGLTLGPPMTTDFPAHITNIGFEYDPVVYAPLYWGNPLTMLNALAAFELVHGGYLTPNSASDEPMAYGYTDAELAEQLDPTLHPENFRHDSEGNTYVMIPAKSLPIVDLVTSVLPAQLQPVAKPVADLVSPALKVLIDLGYDWSGDPGQKRTLSLAPFDPLTNWATVGVHLAVASVQGIQAFIGDLGALKPVAPSTPAPLTTDTVSTLALRSTPAVTAESSDTASGSEAKTTKPTLKLVKKSDTSEQNAAAKKQGDNSTEVKKDDTSTSNDQDATKPDETPSSGKSDTTATSGKKADNKKSDDKKADVTTKKDTKKKADNGKKSNADKKDADSAKAAA